MNETEPILVFCVQPDETGGECDALHGKVENGSDHHRPMARLGSLDVIH
jgi:hypothetical protein